MPIIIVVTLIRIWIILIFAIDDYTRAIDLNPNYVEAYNNRGAIYNNIREPELAIADFDKVIELDPNYVNVLSQSRQYLQQQRQL